MISNRRVAGEMARAGVFDRLGGATMPVREGGMP